MYLVFLKVSSNRPARSRKFHRGKLHAGRHEALWVEEVDHLIYLNSNLPQEEKSEEDISAIDGSLCEVSSSLRSGQRHKLCKLASEIISGNFPIFYPDGFQFIIAEMPWQ